MIDKYRRTVARMLLIAALLVIGSCNMSFAAVNKDVKQPVIDAGTAAVYCRNTDEMLYQKNADRRIEPYSTTKLMTALLVAENMKLDQSVTVSSKAASFGGSTMNLRSGEVCTVQELMNGALILSGNDAAYALGEACGGGDVGTFVQMMNDKAKELGCTGTHFVNPNGLAARDHYTTAQDFVKIAAAALTNPTVRRIAGTIEYKMPSTNKSPARTMETHLDLLDSKGAGVIAGKTGFWQSDDCSVALRYKKKGLDLILVQFNADIRTRSHDGARLLAFARKAIVTVPATDPKQSVGKTFVQFGEKTRVETYPRDVVPTYPKRGEEAELTTKASYDHVHAPLKAGDKVGTLSVYANGKKVGTTPLVVAKDVRRGWILSRFYISNMETIGLAVFLMLVFGIAWKLRFNKPEYLAAHDRDQYLEKH